MTEMWHNSQNCCVRMIVLLKNRLRFGIAKSNKFVLRFTHLALSLQLIKQQPDETKFLKGLLRRVLVLLRYIWRGCVKMWNWYRRTYKQARWYGKVGIVCATVVVSFVLYLILVDINFLWLSEIAELI